MPTATDPFGTLRDGAVYLPDAAALVVADLHLGKAAASAVDAPLDEGSAIVDRLAALVDRFSPETVVLAGDVLHAYGSVPRDARTALTAIGERAAAVGAELVAVAGNHDSQLDALADHDPVDEHALPDGTTVCHGHERPATARRYVLGHDHPAIVIEGRRRPCYLYGPGTYRGTDVLALPAFNPGVRGTSVNDWTAGDPLSPLLADVAGLHPVVWDGDVEEGLVFPALGALREYL